MQLNVRKEPAGVSNLGWLDSREGVDTAATCTLDPNAFSEFKDAGVIPSGTPLFKKGTYFEPGTADNLTGFLLYDQAFDGKHVVIAPYIDRGRVRVDRLPSRIYDAAPQSPNARFVFVKAGV